MSHEQIDFCARRAAAKTKIKKFNQHEMNTMRPHSHGIAIVPFYLRSSFQFLQCKNRLLTPEQNDCASVSVSVNTGTQFFRSTDVSPGGGGT